jgi:hypothetical protein
MGAIAAVIRAKMEALILEKAMEPGRHNIRVNAV